MRRVVIVVTALILSLFLSLIGAGWSRAEQRPTTLRATTLADAGAPGSLVGVRGQLLDAGQHPLGGVPVTARVAGTGPVGVLKSLSGENGQFELDVPLPDQVPAGRVLQVEVSFAGTAEAAATSLTLPVTVTLPAKVDPGAPHEVPAPAVTPPTETVQGLPTTGSTMLDQLIVAAGGLLGLMVVLFVIGAVLRRRRRA